VPAEVTRDHVRSGTTRLLAAFDLAGGFVIATLSSALAKRSCGLKLIDDGVTGSAD
jgi:hypothetical protein